MGGVHTNPEELSHIRRLYSAGFSYTDIGRKLSRSSTFVAAKVRSMGVKQETETTDTGEDVKTSVTVASMAKTLDIVKSVLALNLNPEDKVKIITAIVEE